ncbi:MAG: hypothetical protein N2167_11210 [Flavobacteriales bacterium]|nr:hypothetical protein [Flavobacteriales bacterium]
MTTEPVKQAPKSLNSPTGTVSARKTISIKNFNVHQKIGSPMPEVLEVNESEVFTFEKFEKAWAEYLNQLMKQKKMTWYAMMKRNIPKINENLLIEFVLDHKGQEPEFSEFRVEFLSYLRQVLNNGKIEMEAVIRQDTSAKIPITPAEKLEELMKKNPVLKKFTDDLGLEISL